MPSQKTPEDVNNFDPDFTQEEPTLTPIDDPPIPSINQEEFVNFSFTAPELLESLETPYWFGLCYFCWMVFQEQFVAACSPLTRGFKVQDGAKARARHRSKKHVMKPSSGSLFVKWCCYSSAVVRRFVWPGDSEAFMTKGHSVWILLYIFSSLDGYSCWMLNEFALFFSIKPHLWFTLSFSAVQRKKKREISQKAQAANRHQDSEQMKSF